MRNVYRALAAIIAVEVLIQAASVVYGVFGLAKYVDDGHTLTSQMFDEGSNTSFSGLGGLMLHGMNGMMIIPLLGLLFLISSFFAKVPKGVMWALITFGLIIVQVALGLFAHDIPALGILHGPNALVLFGAAIMAFMRAKAPEAAAAPAAATYGATTAGTTSQV
jgi:hypothetical protein